MDRRHASGLTTTVAARIPAQRVGAERDSSSGALREQHPAACQVMYSRSRHLFLTAACLRTRMSP